MTHAKLLPQNRKSPGNGGYIALMTTIIISMALLVMVAQEGFAGWHARFNVLGTEAKEQATALADGCADQALMLVITGFSYSSSTTLTLPSGTCSIAPMDTSSKGFATIRSQANVRGSYANISIVFNVNDVHLGSTPSSPGISSPNVTILQSSWQELPI